MNNRENSFYIICWTQTRLRINFLGWGWGTKVPQDPSFYYFILFIATAFPFIIL